MKKSYFFASSLLAFSLFSQGKANAQVFQNNNTACESTTVLCSSATTPGYTNCASYAKDITCINSYGAETDMNNDTYSDCVLLNSFDNITSPSPVSIPTFGIINNAGASQNSCGGSPGILNNANDYYVASLPSITQLKDNGSLVTGRFANTDTGDSVWLHRLNTEPQPYIGLLLGGFDTTIDETALLELGTYSPANYATGYGYPTLAVSDCENQALVTDVYYPLIYTPSDDKLYIHALRYSAYDENISTSISVSQNASTSITVADYNGDGQNDVAVAVNDPVSAAGLGSQIVVCLSTGSCSSNAVPTFSCYAIPVSGGGTLHSGDDPETPSIISGDFNGDSYQDIAIVEMEMDNKIENGVHIFQGLGNGSFDTLGVHINGNFNATLHAGPQALAKGCFDNDNNEDIAFSYESGSNGAVGVIFSEVDGSGNYTSTSATELAFADTVASTVTGISTANFDKAGGDDIIALSTNGSSIRSADLFMNTVETVSADAGATALVETGATLSISDATCSVSPADADMTYTIGWSTTTTPLGASAPSYSSTTVINPSVTFTSPGTYILKLSCTAVRCGTPTSNFHNVSNKIVKVSNPIACGNGLTESGEACDDGNAVNGDGCTACVLDTCGDGVTQSGEGCDDGNRIDGDNCSASCVSEGCGNGNLQSSLGETCDDGNTTNGDGCNQSCLIEACGNGRLDAGESCEDSNIINGDGCDSSCKLEVCGDNIIDQGEICEDGNTTSGDGCSSTCQSEGQVICGNSIREAGEGCDDGNAVSEDGCSERCTVETETPVCGNRTLEESEACDDGNTVNNDGCNSSCAIENNSLAICGNGGRELGDNCDDGNRLNGDGCSTVCISEATAGVSLDSQGGCIASLDPQAGSSKSSLFVLMGGMMALLLSRRRVKN